MTQVHRMHLCAIETLEFSKSNTLDLGMQIGCRIRLSQIGPRQ